MVDLLEQWLKDNKTYTLEPSTQIFAEDIFELCGGHAGLTGFCCHHLSTQLAKSDACTYTAAEWAKQCAFTLPEKLRHLGTYERIIQDLRGLDPARLELLREVRIHPLLSRPALDLTSRVQRELCSFGSS